MHISSIEHEGQKKVGKPRTIELQKGLSMSNYPDFILMVYPELLRYSCFLPRTNVDKVVVFSFMFRKNKFHPNFILMKLG